ILVVSVLGSAAVAGHLRFRTRSLVRCGVAMCVATIGMIGGLRVLSAAVLTQPYNKNAVFTSMELVTRPVPVGVDAEAPPGRADAGDRGPVLAAIRQRHVLRVGLVADALPFVFTNTAGRLVGHDVDLAHRLARELGVTLEFVPVTQERLLAQLDAGECD